LISEGFAAFTRQLLQRDGVLDVYLHSSADPISVSVNGQAPQMLPAVPIGRGVAQLLDDSLRALDGLLALKLRLVPTPEAADVRVICSTSIPVGSDGESTLGLSLIDQTPGSPHWDVLINAGELAADQPYAGYTVIHEFGHVLGLEHLFDGSDGDRFGSRSPWRSLYPDETVMAYRRPRAGLGWSQSYRYNDVAAMAKLWGLDPGAQLPADSTSGARLRGSAAADVLIGSPGSERISGLDGDDLLIDGAGADRLEGGLGENLYRCESDGQRDQIWIQTDGQPDLVRSLGAEDRLVVSGVSRRELRFDLTAIDTRAYGTLPGIGIWVAGRLEALVADSAWSLEQVSSITRVLAG
jgi:hypothetical protein